MGVYFSRKCKIKIIRRSVYGRKSRLESREGRPCRRFLIECINLCGRSHEWAASVCINLTTITLLFGIVKVDGHKITNIGIYQSSLTSTLNILLRLYVFQYSVNFIFKELCHSVHKFIPYWPCPYMEMYRTNWSNWKGKNKFDKVFFFRF